MKTLIIGANGSMGKRYQAIFDYLSLPTICADIEHSTDQVLEFADQASGIIIATPTDTHIDFLKMLSDSKKPILCEKPLSKKETDLALISLIAGNMNLTMTMQYKSLDSASSKGVSYYDYFRHGSDGLKWDCVQIIGLARGIVHLSEKSPFWKCMLNGRELSLSAMDGAYVHFVKQWLKKPGDDLDQLLKIHEKVINF